MSVILVTSSLKAWLPAVFQCRCPVGYVVCLVVIILLDYFFLSEVALLLLILLVFFCCPFLVYSGILNPGPPTCWASTSHGAQPSPALSL